MSAWSEYLTVGYCTYPVIEPKRGSGVKRWSP